MPMSALHAAALKAFKAQGWSHTEVSGMEVVEMAFEAHHAKIPVHAQSYGDAGIISVVAQAAMPVPRTHRLPAAEMLMRVNKELNVGNFELDWDEGRVMFRVKNTSPTGHYDENILAGLVHLAIAEMDRLTPFLGEICRVSKSELPLLRVPDLLRRSDLLPPPLEE